MENLESGPYVVICQEDINASESIVGLYDFINGEGVRGFIQGRKLNENDYAKKKPLAVTFLFGVPASLTSRMMNSSLGASPVPMSES